MRLRLTSSVFMVTDGPGCVLSVAKSEDIETCGFSGGGGNLVELEAVWSVLVWFKLLSLIKVVFSRVDTPTNYFENRQENLYTPVRV